jgi:hypothetical protein
MGSTWNGEVTFIAHDTTDVGFQVTSFADSVERDRPFTDYGDVTKIYNGRGGLALPLFESNEVNALIVTFGGNGAVDTVTEEWAPFTPAAQSDGGTYNTGYRFHEDTVFVVMGMNGLNPDNLAVGFYDPPNTAEGEASVRARWLGFTLILP